MKYGRVLGWLMLLALLATFQIIAILTYVDDQRYLAKVFDGTASSKLPPSDQVKEVLSWLRMKPVIINDSYLILPIFGFLRPTARQVAEWGGDCADRSRLLICLLHLRSIKASKWSLYSPDLRPQHAVVEAEVEGGKMAVDPLFGLWFPRPEGGYYGIKDLKEHPRILQQRILSLCSRGEQPGAASLKWYPLDRYVYENARTINWDKDLIMRLIYKSLRWMIGNRVDEIPRPQFVEQPALIVAYGMTILEGAILVLPAVKARWSRKVSVSSVTNAK